MVGALSGARRLSDLERRSAKTEGFAKIGPSEDSFFAGFAADDFQVHSLLRQFPLSEIVHWDATGWRSELRGSGTGEKALLLPPKRGSK
jgi:hypothetical protein